MTSLFVLCFILYVIVGVSLIPMFTRARYKELRIDHYSENGARSIATKQGWAKSIVWPVSVANHIAMKPIVAEAEAERKREFERKEVERILKEDEERDPVNQAFKLLEKEEMLARQQELERVAKEAREENNKMWEARLKELDANVEKLPKKLNQEAIYSLQKKQKQTVINSHIYSAGGFINTRNFTVNGQPIKSMTEDDYADLIDEGMYDDDDDYDVTHIRRGDGSIMKTIYTPGESKVHRSDREIMVDYDAVEAELQKTRLNFEQITRIFDSALTETDKRLYLEELGRLRDLFATQVAKVKALEREVHEKYKL